MKAQIQRGKIERVTVTLNMNDLIKAARASGFVPKEGFTAERVEEVDGQRDLGDAPPFIEVEFVREDLCEPTEKKTDD